MTDRPGTQPEPRCPDGYDMCKIHIDGYVLCPKPCPPKMCNKYLHLPCSVEGEDIILKIQQFQNQPANANATVVQVIDHGHDGWTVIFEMPC